MSDVEQQAEAEIEAPEPTESEAKARRQGWRPRDEYRGDEDKWVDADAFLKRSDEELPVMRERLRKMEKDFATQQATIKKFAEHHAKVQEAAYDRAMADLRKQRREAIAIGDADAMEKAEERLEELKEMKPGTQKQEAAAIAPEVHAWVEKNAWFQPNTVMGKYAAAALDEIAAENPGMPLDEQLNEVTKEVKRRFPEKFANAKRAAPPAVEPSGPVAAASKGAKTYASLPAEARAACDRFVKSGLMTKDQYVKDFFEL